ncbi:MAG TPA: hypothetical protein VGF62_02230 [Rhizomicrobium sp.]|jgi:general secretion pathway protein K
MNPVHNERGWALASVLWVVTMLALMAAATQELTIISSRTERRAWESAEASAAFDATAVQAVAGIAAPTVLDRWRVDGVSRDISVSGFPVRVVVQAEAGRYDLNAVDASVLMDLLRSAGVEPEHASALAGNILDWRSPGPFHVIDGATDADYLTAGMPCRPRHAPFQHVDELQLVLGMTPDLFGRIRPALTVYSKRATIDPMIAPRESLLALYHGDQQRVDALLQARDAPSAENIASRAGIMNPGLALAGEAFTIAAQVEIARRIYRRSVVVLLTGLPARPFLILARSS